MNPIRLGSCSYSNDGCSMTIDNLTREEMDTLKSFLLGTSWVRIDERGRLESTPRFQTLPSPGVDEEMFPFWTMTPPELLNAPQQTVMCFAQEEFKCSGSLPTIVIEHLCGYYSTPDKYANMAERLTSWGFEVMRSKRGADGKYWEQWVLHNPSFFSKGTLKEFIGTFEKNTSDDENLTSVVSWLCKNASFGSLSVNKQRAAMVIEIE